MIDTATALDHIDDAIASVEAARDASDHHPSLTGSSVAHGRGYFGQALDDLQVLRGRVEDAHLTTA